MVEKVQAATGTNKPVVQDEARLRPAASEVRALVADYSRLGSACGWTPAVDLNEGVARPSTGGAAESNRSISAVRRLLDLTGMRVYPSVTL